MFKVRNYVYVRWNISVRVTWIRANWNTIRVEERRWTAVSIFVDRSVKMNARNVRNISRDALCIIVGESLIVIGDSRGETDGRVVP